ncbi:MAG: hydroxymethylbilane synthase [Candidatus Devosia symbiotica]|nr:hydroxymethylbilane synthase [Candidatus Devosia symbiotica]
MQARLVRSLLTSTHGIDEDDIEIVVLSTGGDHIQVSNASLSEIGGKGLFTKEIDEAMLTGRVDIGVHSSKDVATQMSDGLALAAFFEREDVRDAFLSVKVQSLDQLAEHAKFRTFSIRRAAQVLRQRPDLQIVPFRGNVGARLQKLADGVADATLLAMAGLNRLGEGHRATGQMDPEIFLPAPAQGAIGLAVRSDDTRMAGLVAALDHPPTNLAITAERAMLAVLDGSCRTPVGALTRLDDGTLTLKGQILSLDGQTAFDSAATGVDPLALGRRVGADLLARVGSEFMAQWTAT